jgi:hypothetical protein
MLLCVSVGVPVSNNHRMLLLIRMPASQPATGTYGTRRPQTSNNLLDHVAIGLQQTLPGCSPSIVT